jgi:hypothetical protein
MKKLILFFLILLCQITLAQTVDIPDANFKAALIEEGVDTNHDGEIQVSEAEAVTDLFVVSNEIFSLEGINSFINLRILDCGFNELTVLDLNLPNLTHLFCNKNELTALDVSHLSELVELNCADNHQFTSLNFTGLSNLTHLNIAYTGGTSNLALDFTGLSSLEVLHMELVHYSSIIGLENLTNLVSLDTDLSPIHTLNLSNLSKLKHLDCFSSSISTFILPVDSSLEYLDFSINPIGNLDLSNQKKLKVVHALLSELESLNIKNGSVEDLINISNNPDLRYICVDPEQFDEVQNLIADFGYTNCVVTTYCSFEPGGDTYNVQGSVKVDIDQDGCDPNDLPFPFMQFMVSDTHGNMGIYSSDISGNYNIPLPEGDRTIHYQFPYMSYFDISPSSFSVSFPSDTSPYEEDICLTPNGTYNDLQIAIIPLEQARPGFDATYKIVYANVGTTILSGDVTLNFEENVLDFVSASTSPDTQSNGELSWSFSNLAPFDIKTIDVTFNLNAPTETPPLNDGDILCYEAFISPLSNDEVASDNSFSLKQTVVNSYDPNDKTCLEGDIITPDLVGEYVHYLIRFENTGSASAISVVVKDVIDTNKFDMNTFLPMNASHDFVTRIQNENEVEFIFEGINLPFDDANNDGFVLFKIKTLPSLEVGDTFENNAEIYFDFNFPIITNVAETLIDNVASSDDFTLYANLQVYPSPAEDQLIVESQRSFDTALIYDLTGKELKRVISTQSRVSQEIDVSDLESGIYIISILSGTSKTTQKFLKR